MLTNTDSMRSHVAERYGQIVPDEWVLTDEPDAFTYQTPSGTIVGWNRNTEIFWRNVHAKPGDE